jgi:hypothetical protein
MDELSQGLVDFYSGQANAMLVQYEDINRLLGQTSDWTGPGTLCETLLRNFLRKHVLSGMSVDKGFVYGRVTGKKPEGHGPEIDILIHDIQHHRPVFRMDDFVIVQPESVLAMIQVKRTLRGGKENSLAEGIENVAQAMQHVIDVQHQSRETLAGGKMPKHPTVYERLNTFDGVFTAVVGFDGPSSSHARQTYQDALTNQYQASQAWEYEGAEYDTGVATLPDFVGSLQGTCLISFGHDFTQKSYHVYPAKYGEKNIALQLFLFRLTQQLFDWRKRKPPFAFPQMPDRDQALVVIPDSPRQPSGG